MKLVICTIVLDGLPFLIRQLDTFRRLTIPWEWRLAEGASEPVADTSWCKPTTPRLSADGTTEFLENLARQCPNVRHFTRKLWPGKTAQINACLDGVQAPAIVLQSDCDEFFSADQIEEIVAMFEAIPDLGSMQFLARHLIGPAIEQPVVGSWGNSGGFWRRAWRMTANDQRFISHEPPRFNNGIAREMGYKETSAHGFWFYHHGYVLRSQLAAKEAYYGYTGAVAGWERLQRQQDFPVKLRQFMPWVDDRAMADRVV